MAEVAAFNAAAKASVAKLCDTLITRSSFFTTFDESRGATDYARWRKDLLTTMQSVGAGFKESIVFTGSVPEATTMTNHDIMLDTAAGHSQLTMPQMRQQAMLIAVRATLSPGGESIRLIADCVHAGGVVQRGGVNHDQALRLLDQLLISAGIRRSRRRSTRGRRASCSFLWMKAGLLTSPSTRTTTTSISRCLVLRNAT